MKLLDHAPLVFFEYGFGGAVRHNTVDRAGRDGDLACFAMQRLDIWSHQIDSLFRRLVLAGSEVIHEVQ